MNARPNKTVADLTEQEKTDLFLRVARGEQCECPLEGCAQPLHYMDVKYGTVMLKAAVCPDHGNVSGARVAN